MTLLLRVNHLLNPRPARLSTAPWLAGLVAAVVSIALWWFALSAPVPKGTAAEKGTAELTGTVVDSSNQPLSGVEVQVYKGQVRIKQVLGTDAKGQFKVPSAWRDWNEGAYTLVVRDRDRLGWFDLSQNPKEQDPSFRIVLFG